MFSVLDLSYMQWVENPVRNPSEKRHPRFRYSTDSNNQAPTCTVKF